MKRQMNKRWWSMLLLGVLLILVFKLIDRIGTLWGWMTSLLNILTPFIVGFVVAFLLYRPSAALEGKIKNWKPKLFSKHARGWSLTVVYLGLTGVLVLIGWVIVPLFTQGVTGLIAALPGYYQNVNHFIATHKDESWVAALNIPEVVEGVYAYIREHLTVENILGYLSGVVSITTSFLNVVIAFIISVYMLASRETLLHTIRHLASAFLRERTVRLAAHYSNKAADIFTRYVFSMLLDAVIIFVLVIPGLLIAGVPYPLAFALFIGVANFIPYFGATVSGVIVALVPLFNGHWGMAIFLALYVLVMQQIDGNLIKPRIFSQSVGIEPIYVLLAIILGGGIGGLVGMLIGVPVMAVLKILISDFLLHRDRLRREREAAEQKDQ